MEQNLEKFMEEVTSEAGVTGCVVSDSQGLCLGVKGTASIDSSGIITAIANQAARLEPANKQPIILLENENRKCLIQKNGPITCAIYKTAPPT